MDFVTMLLLSVSSTTMSWHRTSQVPTSFMYSAVTLAISNARLNLTFLGILFCASNCSSKRCFIPGLANLEFTPPYWSNMSTLSFRSRYLSISTEDSSGISPIASDRNLFVTRDVCVHHFDVKHFSYHSNLCQLVCQHVCQRVMTTPTMTFSVKNLIN